MNDIIEIEEDEFEITQDFSDYWTIAVIDDEQLVVEVTELVLDGVTINGRRLHVLSANTAKSGFELIKSNPYIAVALIDIVMEDPESGFDLINNIRSNLPYHPIRLIIRTGQPGYRSKDEILASYDIDAYLEKSTMTHQTLVETLENSINLFQEETK